MIQVRATVTSERGEPPGPELKPLFEEMGAFHEEMARAGVLLDGAGLRPSRQGWRQRYHLDGRREVIDGPCGEPQELIAGYTLIQVKSREEAMEWARRFPNPAGRGKPAEIEVRPLYELDEFAPSPEIERMRNIL